MEQTEITRNIVELREFEAGTREQIHTIFNRLDKQDALIESMRELTANVGTLAEGQERIEKNVRAVRQDVDELKAKPMANYEKVRLTIITALASGFLYYVSLKGVTGAGHLDVESVRAKLAEFSNLTDVPICVGFGIKDPETARAIADFADGVIVGSALVTKMGDLAHADSNEIADTVAELVGSIRVALDA